ncbi:MAG: endolytic transglycosylase MltG [Chloroherpetonaceae bacterium]
MPMRYVIRVVVVLFALALIALTAGYIYLFKSSLNTFEYEEPKLIKIHRGYSYRDIVNELHKAGVIKYKAPMLFLARLMPETYQIKPGRYYVPSGMTCSELVLFLYSRKQDEAKIRIPDGCYGWDVAKLVGENLDTDSASFMQAFTDPKLLKELGVDAPNFEGYLLADTYNIPWALTAEDALRFLVGKFRQFYNDSLRARAERMGLTELEVLTLASIVQRETSSKEEMPIVAGVYLNRLKKGMKLQADPTFIYAAILANDYDGNPNTPRHRERDSPYNTYKYSGLPPGPIGNPTREAILATLYPKKTDYLFFVATGYGGHNFSRTYEEHSRYAQLYYARRQQVRDSLARAEKMQMKNK